jgi:hypothetical protein
VSGTTAPPPSGTPPLNYSFVDTWQPDVGQNSVGRAYVDHNSLRPLFEETVLRPEDSVSIDVRMAACSGNYSFRMAVQWRVAGSTEIHTSRSPQYFLYGEATNATLLQSYEHNGRVAIQESRVTGSNRNCGEPSPFPKITPTPTPERSPTPTHTATPTGTPTLTP